MQIERILVWTKLFFFNNTFFKCIAKVVYNFSFWFIFLSRELLEYSHNFPTWKSVNYPELYWFLYSNKFTVTKPTFYKK